METVDGLLTSSQQGGVVIGQSSDGEKERDNQICGARPRPRIVRKGEHI